MSASAHRRSCGELGACQSRATPCTGCAYPYAPGTIEHHRRTLGTPAQRLALVLWLKRSLAFAAACALLALVAGALVGH